MKTNTCVASLLSACFALGISVANAESLDAFLKRNLVSVINAGDLHPEGKYIQYVGREVFSLNSSQFLSLHQKNRSMGTKTEILDFKILSKYETGDLVSVVVKAKVRARVGSSETVGEVLSHDILLNQGGRWVSVFSIGRQ